MWLSNVKARPSEVAKVGRLAVTCGTSAQGAARGTARCCEGTLPPNRSAEAGRKSVSGLVVSPQPSPPTHSAHHAHPTLSRLSCLALRKLRHHFWVEVATNLMVREWQPFNGMQTYLNWTIGDPGPSIEVEEICLRGPLHVNVSCLQP